MAPDPHTVKCAICGKEIVLPPGPERAKARCTACGSPLAAQSPPEPAHAGAAPARRAQRQVPPGAAPPGTSPGQGTQVTCAVCGKQMLIPPGYDKAKARCSACGTELGAPTPLAELERGRSVAPKKSAAYTRNSKWADVREALLPGILWGILGGVIGGVPMLAYKMVQVHRLSEPLPIAAAIALAGSGASIGFVLCTTWVVVRKAAIGPVASAALCGCLSLILGTFFYVFEWAFLAPSDFNVLANAVVCTMGGGFTGIVVHYTIAYFE